MRTLFNESRISLGCAAREAGVAVYGILAVAVGLIFIRRILFMIEAYGEYTAARTK